MLFLTIRMINAVLSDTITLNITNLYFINLQTNTITICPFFILKHLFLTFDYIFQKN